MFSTLSDTDILISAAFNVSSANALNLDQSKNFSFGKELNLYHTIVSSDIPFVPCLNFYPMKEEILLF